MSSFILPVNLLLPSSLLVVIVVSSAALVVMCNVQPLQSRSRVASVSIVFDYGLDYRAIGVLSPARAKDFSSSLCVQTGSEAHPASCTMGTGRSFPRGKARPGRDADHSPPSSAEVRNE
jgi:hypothetical protein